MASGSYMSAVIRGPLKFRMEYPAYADAARECIRARPDVRSLRYVAATVGRWATGGIPQVFVELESPDRLLTVKVRPQIFGRFTDESVIDRQREPWERERLGGHGRRGEQR